MDAESKFSCDVEEIPDAQNQITTYVRGHGRLVSGDTELLKRTVQPLLVKGGRTVIDCADISYLDSMGLGSLVALKVSSVNKGFGTLEFVHLSPRIKELLRITHLTEFLARPDTINYGS